MFRKTVILAGMLIALTAVAIPLQNAHSHQLLATPSYAPVPNLRPHLISQPDIFRLPLGKRAPEDKSHKEDEHRTGEATEWQSMAIAAGAFAGGALLFGAIYVVSRARRGGTAADFGFLGRGWKATVGLFTRRG
ncbi:hypothetical protein BDV95DRAFT_599048 [Massariosphaeria phaeospora]|uniref:Transmembrane protein n=1 Tax=Massariosphaeria phaeospora TaxID=100035 RepID=A0A7C8I3Z2_9PLEO|nr:hypothetical protein BDV95DRAFT_599048 [Massariosphaeria phaeospora]